MVFVFADDMFILARSPAVYMFADIMRGFLAEIYAWDIKSSMVLSYGKCTYRYTVIPPKEKMENYSSRFIWMDKYKVNFSRQIKYLGVVFEWDYSWMSHLDLIEEKATTRQ